MTGRWAGGSAVVVDIKAKTAVPVTIKDRILVKVGKSFSSVSSEVSNKSTMSLK